MNRVMMERPVVRFVQAAPFRRRRVVARRGSTTMRMGESVVSRLLIGGFIVSSLIAVAGCGSRPVPPTVTPSIPVTSETATSSVPAGGPSSSPALCSDFRQEISGLDVCIQILGEVVEGASFHWMVVSYRNPGTDAAVVEPHYELSTSSGAPINEIPQSLVSSAGGIFVGPGAEEYDWVQVPASAAGARAAIKVNRLAPKVDGAYRRLLFWPQCLSSTDVAGGCRWINQNPYPIKVRPQMWLLANSKGVGAGVLVRSITSDSDTLLPANSTTFVPIPDAQSTAARDWLKAGANRSYSPTVVLSTQQPNFFAGG